jgi:glutaredoxin-related protein
MITDKKINKILSKIHPTEGEVKSMDEWEWITQVYIIKCFRAGMDYAINNKEQKA